ncbi:O-antigen ligase family protein [Pseudomonadales bacterium]|nr:O-antigen ligase family protein [Pseudomonadales bacterium]
MTKSLSLPHGMLALIFALAVLYDGNPVLALSCLVLLTLTSLVMIWPKLNGEAFAWSRVHWALLAYLAWQSCLVFLSIVPENSLLMYGVWVSLVVVTYATVALDGAGWRRVFGFFLVAGLLTAIWGIVESVVTGIRANGPIVDPNAWAALNNLFYFLLLGIYITVPRLRWVSLILAAVFVTAVFFSHSRMGLAVFLVGSLFLLTLTWGFRDLRRPIAVMFGVLLMCFAALQITKSNSYAEFTVDKTATAWTVRFSMWRAALDISAEHPIVGVGPGTFNLHYPRYHETADDHTTGSFVHNDYLQFLAEGGPLLLGFLLLFTGYLIYHLVDSGWRVLRGDRSQLEPLILVVGMGAVLGQCLMNFPLYLIQVQMLMGLALARLITLKARVYRTQLRFESAWLSKASALIIALLVTTVSVLDGLGFDIVYQRSIPLVRDIHSSPSAYYQTMAFLRAARSLNSRTRIAMARLYRLNFDHETDPDVRYSLAVAVALEYQAALRINPYHSGVRRQFAEFLEQNPELLALPEIELTPLQHFEMAVALRPIAVDVQLAFVDFLERNGQPEAAYKVLTGDALKWVNKRQDYFVSNRERVCALLIQRAQARHDLPALEKLVATVDPLIINKVMWDLRAEKTAVTGVSPSF